MISFTSVLSANTVRVFIKSCDIFDYYCMRSRIKENNHSHIPIIVLTAKSEQRDRILSFELGADDYITKPFPLKELTARVKAVLRRRSGEMIRRKSLSVAS